MGQVVRGWQMHALLTHVEPPGQVPQLVTPPQALVMSPHTWVALQTGAGQTQVVPLHVLPPLQVPQFSVPPQLSGAVPQVCPAGHDVRQVLVQ